MSLGFLTESALMPSKAKKIEVDSTSMIGLKALVYQGEQKTKANASSRSSGLRTLRGTREPSERKRDINEARNSGVELRISQDEEKLETVDKIKTYQAALKAKAQIYDRIRRGEAEEGTEAAFLVDFKRKKDTNDVIHEDTFHQEEEENDTQEDEYVDIEDEFGREKRVKKRSQEYLDFLSNKRHKASNISIRPENFSNCDDTLNERTRTRTSEEEEEDKEKGAGEVFAWSTGVNRDDAGEWIPSSSSSHQLHDTTASGEVQDAIQREILMSKSARVKTQWETTLGSSARDFITQVHKEAEVGRSNVNGAPAKSSKDQRRELLRQKQAARLQSS